jgi:hypothetical protein
MKLANPLYYPLAVLAGAIALVAGARFTKLPSFVVIPVAAVIATAGATALKMQEPEPLNFGNSAVEREFRSIQQQARDLVEKANLLRAEAAQLLTQSDQIDLLGSVQYACDRACELPIKLEQFARRLQGSDSLLSIAELQQQRKQAEARYNVSRGVAREQLKKLITSLERNIDLARHGQDARQAQLVSLSTLILDSAGVLQQMQNQLRTADLADASQTIELRSLSNDFKLFQENVDLLVAR